MKKETSDKYWKAYKPLQQVKHQFIKKYLEGFFPKMALGTQSARILYLDTHAGRGKHETGEQGSPLIALKTLLDHNYRDKILQKSEIIFYFIEKDQKNYEALEKELENHEIPPRIKVILKNEDASKWIDEGLSDLKSSFSSLVPAFIFIDPFGFQIHGKFLTEILQYEKTELLLTIIIRELDIAIQNAFKEKKGFIDLLNQLFDSEEWKENSKLKKENEIEDRAKEISNLYETLTQAKYSTHIPMFDKNSKIPRYYLLHLTNHRKGKELMKECIWRIFPEGDFRSLDLSSLFPEHYLERLKTWVLEKLKKKNQRWKDLEDQLLHELWLPKHLQKILSEFRKEGKIEAREFEGRFCRKSNPLLVLKR